MAAACTGGEGDASPRPTAPPDEVTSTTAPPGTVAGGAELGELPPPPELLEVVYRVERLTTGVVDTEQRLARSPFEVRIETHRAEPDDVDLDADPVLLDLAVLGGAETGPVDQERVLVVVPPTPALRSAHLGTDLRAAGEAGVLEPLGYGREIAGRECAELRTGAPLDGGILRAPTEETHNDVCVDADGLVLREEITNDGELVERRTAVSVAIDAPLPDDGDELFGPLGHRIPEAEGGGRVRRLTPDSRPPDVAHHQLAAPPAGMDLVGRFGVLTDAPTAADAAGAVGAVGAVISVADVYAGDGEVLVVENGAAVTGGPVLGRGDVGVPLPFAPDATALFLTSGVEIRAPLATGRFVRITSTLTLDQTLELASSLTEVGGPGDVVPLDEEPDITGRLEPTG